MSSCYRAYRAICHSDPHPVWLPMPCPLPRRLSHSGPLSFFDTVSLFVSWCHCPYNSVSGTEKTTSGLLSLQLNTFSLSSTLTFQWKLLLCPCRDLSVSPIRFCLPYTAMYTWSSNPLDTPPAHSACPLICHTYIEPYLLYIRHNKYLLNKVNSIWKAHVFR